MTFPSWGRGGVSRSLMAVVMGVSLLSACGQAGLDAKTELKPVFPDDAPLAHRHRKHSLTESPDGQLRIYAWQQGDVTDLMLMKRKNRGGWTEPVMLDFPKRETNTSPRFFPNGDLYYSSDAQHPGRVGRTDLNIWRVTQQNGVFGTPEVMPDSINTGSDEDTFAPLGDGRAVFSSTTLGGTGGYDLYIAEQESEGWSVTPFPHNTLMADSHPVAADNGTILIWYGHLPSESVYGAVDLFVSRLEDDQWSVPENLGPLINTSGIEYGAGVSADGETLFFSRDGVLLETQLQGVLDSAGYIQVP